MFVPILLLSLLGASSAQFFFHQPSTDNSQSIVETFLAKIVKTIETKDASKISDLFADDFFFHGCRGDYDKKKIVAMLSMIPSGTHFTVAYKSSKFISSDKIEYFVSIAGFNPVPVAARFILVAGKLEGGSVPACPKFHGFIGYSYAASDDAQATVEKFLTRMVRSIESKDVSIISGLFQPGFVFKGCRGTYDKTKIVGLLSNLPAGTKFSIALNSVEDQSSSIKYLVSANGFGQAEVVAEFVLNKNDQQLESGNVPACQKSIGRRFSDVPEDSQTIIEKFLARMVRSIESKDASIISGLFQPGFVFEGCRGTYDKTKIVGLLSSLPAGTKFSVTLKSVEDLGSSIKYLVSASGFGKTEVVAEFVLNKNDQQLESGNVPDCQKSIGRSFSDVSEDSDAVIQRFLASMKQIIASNDITAIGNLLDDNFSFKGCKGTYNKAQAIGIITHSTSPFKFELKSSQWNNNGQIEYTVAISGPNGPFDAHFVFCPHRNVLKSGSIPSCPIIGFGFF